MPHPVFSGVGGESVSVGVDGYFSTIPAEATVLLRRKLNQEPVMISYPFGEGTVILTSLFSDYANAHSQMSGVDEAHIVRDLLTYARNVKREIPSWQIAVSGQAISISLPEVDIKNDSEIAAAKAKFRVLRPDRKEELYTVERAVSIAPQATGSAALEFSVTPHGLSDELTRNWIGIYHIEVELYDSAGNLIQPYTESDGGRFAIYVNQGKYNPGQGVLRWLTVQQEELYLNQNVELDVHFRNTSDQPQTIDIPDPFLCVDHECSGGYPHIGTPIYLEIPAGEERIYHATIPMKTLCAFPELDISLFPISIRLQYRESGGALRQIGSAKVVFLKKSATRSSLTIQGASGSLKNMSPINFAINSNNWDGVAQGNAKIKLVLEKNVGYESYQEVETAIETEHDFTANNSFQHSGQYVPSQIVNPGAYRLRLTVTTADNSSETRTQQFYYTKSYVLLELPIIPEAIKYDPLYSSARYFLIPGQTYSVNFSLKNASGFAITQGKYTVTLTSADGTEVFRKEVSNIALASSQLLQLSEPFVFSPVSGGKYHLQVFYTDESRTAEMVTITQGTYEYTLKLEASSERPIYHSLEPASILVKIAAIGAVHIKVTDIRTGTVQERDIDVPAGQFSATEVFQVPAGLWYTNNYTANTYVNAEMTDSSGRTSSASTSFRYTAPLVAHVAQTDALGLKEGFPLNLTLKLTEKSGMPAAFPAILSVAAPGLGFISEQTVTIQPGTVNEFNFQIPVAETAAAGVHAIAYKLLIGEHTLIQGNTLVDMPAITLKFPSLRQASMPVIPSI